MRKNAKKVPVRSKEQQELDAHFPPVEAPDSSLQEVQQHDDNDGVGPSGIAWHTEKRRAGDLSEWDKNPRRLTESQAKHLATSLIKFGYVEPIQINTDNKIIGGHMRHRILLQAGLIQHDTMIDVRVPSRLLDEAEYEELAIRLNKNTGAWDFDVLTTEFDQTNLREWGFSPMDFGMAGNGETPKWEPPKPSAEAMKETNLKPSKPRTCTHCDQRCHCVVEEFDED